MSVAAVTGNGPEELRSLIRRLEQVHRKNWLSSTTAALGAESLKLVKDCFTYSRSPYGERWDQVSRGGLPLEDTNRLRNATMNATLPWTGTISIYNATKYAALQNYGGVVRAKNKPYLVFQVQHQGAALAVRGGEVVKRRRGTKEWVSTKQVTIKARRFIPDARGLPPIWERSMRAIAEGRMVSHMEGR